MALTNYDVHMRKPRPPDPRPHIAHPDNPGCVHWTGTGRQCGFPSVVRDADGAELGIVTLEDILASIVGDIPSDSKPPSIRKPTRDKFGRRTL